MSSRAEPSTIIFICDGTQCEQACPKMPEGYAASRKAWLDLDSSPDPGGCGCDWIGLRKRKLTG